MSKPKSTALVPHQPIPSPVKAKPEKLPSAGEELALAIGLDGAATVTVMREGQTVLIPTHLTDPVTGKPLAIEATRDEVAKQALKAVGKVFSSMAEGFARMQLARMRRVQAQANENTATVIDVQAE